MKSKYLDITKFKEALDPHQNNKFSRKQTKPKRKVNAYPLNENQTQSDFQTQIHDKYLKRLKFPLKKNNNSKQLPKSQKPSPRKLNPSKYSESYSNSSINSNKSISQKLQKKGTRQSRNLTYSHHQANFIGELNNYLNQLKRSKLDLNENDSFGENSTLLLNKLNFLNQQKSMQNTLQKTNKWQKKIKKQKSINKNLQKCIIEIQKVLWDRNDKLDMLEDQIRKEISHKQNYIRKIDQKAKNNLSKTIFFNKDFANKTQPYPKRVNKNIIFNQKQSPLNQLSKISSKEKQIYALYDTYSDTQKQFEATFKQKKPRRKTETPINIQKLLSKTLTAKGIQKAKKQKNYNKFQKIQLNDI